MQTVNISDFRSHLAHYLKAAQMGESLSVTSHGEVLAIIMPPNQAKQDAKAALQKMAQQCVVDDVTSSLNESWEAMQ
ncbi:MAG TPA: type II toxin-antitoxin system prevent-host-death family antitoxin [Agitococcus sp.]|nr:type II toxin-antitoxin system prevent-host-death family antitoxin [Moraxellaceae bacterium]HQV24079.1 type II toxin-antitoxin system prevent-host-death family antitoxin [Agitococcus sp.]